MNHTQPTVWKRHLTPLCFILILMCLTMIVGCQEVCEPLAGADGKGTGQPARGPLSDFGHPLQIGPLVTVTNQYTDPVRTSTFMTIPAGLPLSFCWTAQPVTGGGEIEAYRYGWDVFDPSDPENWDVDFTPYDGSNVCSPFRSFDAGTHIFAVEVVDDVGAGTMIGVVMQIVPGPASFDVMPGTCQNALSTARKGRLRTTLPGRLGLELSEIDVSSLYLWVDGNVVEPVETGVADIARPVINGDRCECPPKGRDGIDDFVIYFETAEIVRALGPVSNGETRMLSLRGRLSNGGDFARADCVTIAGNAPTDDDPALFQRDAVLVALERGYNNKDFELVSALLDDDFTFFFSESDVQSGVVPYTQWGREEERTATARLFNVEPHSDKEADRQLRVASVGGRTAEEDATWGKIKAAFFEGLVSGETFIVADLGFPEGEDAWIAVLPPDPSRYPGEVWYEKRANYWMRVEAGDSVLLPFLPRAASFVVRFSEQKGYWQLVQWRDDI